MAPFSYAQAAKGQAQSSPSAQTSRSETQAASAAKSMSPKSAPMSPIEKITSWAEDQSELVVNGERKQEGNARTVKTEEHTPNTALVNGDSTHVDESSSSSLKIATPLSLNAARDDEASSTKNASSESTWGNESQVSNALENGASQTDDGSTTEKGSDPQSKQEAKALKEAPLPPVNFWQQRAQEAKSKTVPTIQSKITSPTIGGKSPDPKPKSPPISSTSSPPDLLQSSPTPNQWGVQEKPTKSNGTNPTRKPADADSSIQVEEASTKSNGPSTKSGNETKPNEQKSRQTNATRTEVPPVKDTISWPTPESAQDEERRRAQIKSDKSDKESSPATPSKPHGKSGWVSVPFIPTVKFNTPLPTTNRRGGGRTGTRGGRDMSSRGGSSGGASSGKPGSASPTEAISDNHVRGRDGSKSARASSLPPKSDREGSADQARNKRSSAQGSTDYPTVAHQALPKHAIPGIQSSTNPTGSVAANVLGRDFQDVSAHDADADVSMHTATSQKSASTQPDTGADSNQARRWRNSYHAESAYPSGEDSGDRRRSVADVSQMNPKSTSWGTRRGEDNGRQFDNYRGDQRSDRGRGMRSGRGGSQYGNNPHHSSNSQLPNGHLPPIQTSSFPAKSPQSVQSQQLPQFGSNPRGGYRGAPRSQSIPTEPSYGRYTGPFPGMVPIQPPPYMTSPYDGASMQPPMSAQLPYGPYYDQYQLIGMVSFQLEYYFSTDNLLKDMFLRKQMDSQGFVFLTVVAGFNRIRTLTTDLELIKFVCLTTPSIEIRIGGDGRERLRKSDGWKQFVLDMADRDPSARNDGPRHLDPPMNPFSPVFENPMMARPSMPTPDLSHGSSPSFPQFNGAPGAFTPIAITSPANGLTFQSPHSHRYSMPPGESEPNARIPPPPVSDVSTRSQQEEQDSFPDEGIVTLTVLIKPLSDRQRAAPYHSASSRTFSNGSIDSRTMMEELQRNDERQSRSLHKTNGPADSDASRKLSAVRSSVPSQSPDKLEVNAPPIRLYWMKGKEPSRSEVPEGYAIDQYVYLHSRAMERRLHASPGECPYDMDTLYQFWSHFLIRNFNTLMYNEFRQFAFEDAAKSNNTTGITNLIKYYSEALSSQQPIRTRIARHYVSLVKSEGYGSERPAFEQLRMAWRNGALNMKNRKKISDFVDPDLKAELDR